MAGLDLRRPGGFRLTERVLALGNLFPGARILDVGCGSGATVAFARERGLEAFGLDPELEDPLGGRALRALGEALPFAAGSLDAVLLECSLSVTSDPARVLEEARRVLRPRGRLLLTDVFAKGAPFRGGGGLGRVEPLDSILEGIRGAGFGILFQEDASRDLAAFLAQRILDGLACDPCLPAGARAGYVLLAAERLEAP
jgi:SAM-dependent methyltransferase